MLDFGQRFTGEEIMDGPGISTATMEAALAELPRINRWLGGYRATLSTLNAFYASRRPTRLRILDIGTGAGDYPVLMVQWGHRRGIEVEVTALDLSVDAIDFARRRARTLMSPEMFKRIRFLQGNAMDLSSIAESFDICTSAMFFHHLQEEQCVQVLREMGSVATEGVIVNDIHRHALAYYGITVLTRLLPFSAMVRHDGPVSVRRAFSREDLERISDRAGLERGRVSWRWAFRWILTNLAR